MLFKPKDRIQVTDQNHDAWGMRGVVKLVDRHGQVWVQLDGFKDHSYIPFSPDSLQIQPLARKE